MAFMSGCVRGLAAGIAAVALFGASSSAGAEAAPAEAFAKVTARLETKQGLLPVFIDRMAARC